MTTPDSNSADLDLQPVRGAAKRLACVAGCALLLLWMLTCVIMVNETEVVLVERLGQLVKVLDHPEDRGLNFKLPWPVGTVRRFDRRVQLFDPPGREVFTRDRRNVTVESWICWRIADPSGDAELVDRPAVRFFRSLGSIETARARLETRVRSAVATHVAQVELSDLMKVPAPDSPPDASATSLEDLSRQLLADVRQRSDEEQPITERLGIEIVDVRIRRINFPLGNQSAVFERMKSERRKIADRYRSAGLAENTVIRSQADRQHSEILSRAEAEAERIRGEGEAEALAILNTAHARDPEFYRTLQTLDTYRKILTDQTTLVLSASSGLLKMLVDGLPDDSHPPDSGIPPAAVAPADGPVSPAQPVSGVPPARAPGAADREAADPSASGPASSAAVSEDEASVVEGAR